MSITMDDIHRLCDETNMEYEEAVSLLRRFGGDYKKARRAWQDERSIFIEPLSVQEGVRPVSDYIRQAWRRGVSFVRKIRPTRLISLIALLVCMAFSRQTGGWMLLILMFARCLPLLAELLRSRKKHSAPSFVL